MRGGADFLCEFFETSRATESVFAFGPLDREAAIALFGDVHDHVADRIEHLSRVIHGLKVAENLEAPPTGVAGNSHPVRCSQAARHGSKCAAWSRCRAGRGSVQALAAKHGTPSE